jgi:HMG (high mobility group) box
MSDTDSNEYESDEGSVEEEEVVEASPPKKRGSKPKKDPSKPKRNMSAFFLYSQAERANVKASNPDAAFGDIVSEAGGESCP